MNLRPYQQEGVEFLAGRKHALLAFAMRLGKTATAIRACEKVGATNVLVVCPAIAKDVWLAQWKKWSTRAMGVEVISYHKAREKLDALTKQRHKTPPYDVLIVDECHYAKSPDADRTVAIYGKGGLGWFADRVWALSGTPVPNHAGEAWPLLKAFGVTEMSYFAWIQRYCIINKFNGRVVGTRKDERLLVELRAMLDSIMLRRTRREVAPEMDDIAFDFLPINVAEDYDIPPNMTEEQIFQWCRDHADESRDDRQDVAFAKVAPLAEEIVQAFESKQLESTVVFGFHTEPILEMAAKLRARAGIAAETITGSTSQRRRLEIQEAFAKGSIQCVVANIVAAGTAIDLSAASHGYFLELCWTPSDNLQAANRLVNLEKGEKVTFDVATTPGSVDDAVQKVLVRKITGLRNLGLA